MPKNLAAIDIDIDIENDRARAFQWLQDNAEDFLDFEFLEELERL
ncbi:demethylmenaquinone methyltransferase [Streptomyces laurentii]|uniref:Demethylmenaquinone methyltransferase n=1 Tax=Streptomyces laurentii TaxID=39478 RepID=A0A160P2R4_STRLU|nr:demethylmenaquinone methyltransferase [Streptomyces laurentii]